MKIFKNFCRLAISFLMIAAMSTVVSCSKVDDEEENVRNNILGVWKTYSLGDELCLTNERAINEYLPDGKYVYTIFTNGLWFCGEVGSYTVSGNKLTMHYAQNYSSEHEQGTGCSSLFTSTECTMRVAVEDVVFEYAGG